VTYLLVNSPFLLVAFLLIVTALLKTRGARRRTAAIATAVTLAVVCALTAVFDNLIVLAGIVAYDPSKTSGVMVGVAPVEDFAYAVAAALALPALWLLLPERRSRAEHSDALEERTGGGVGR
jgi:lycopene cyclase domain-containing protein